MAPSGRIERQIRRIATRNHALGIAAAALAVTIGAGTAAAKAVPAPPDGLRRPVDLVICLDTSGSMTAMIDSARAKLWDVVTELAKAKPTPYLRVGLLTYGSPGNSSYDQGWIKWHNDLSDDLDTVYANMMSMNTAGGDEFVGWVLDTALQRMSWSNHPDALKIIYVAGNESADQAMERYNFRYVAENARTRGMFINAIYGGSREAGISENWHEVAAHGGGNFTPIDMQQGTIQIPTPYDPILSKLNTELNGTYIPYGASGAAGAANQARQDENAANMGRQSCASRVTAKGTALYSNGAWDLVDACQQQEVDLATVAEKDLPDNMKSMSPEQRKAYVEGMQGARRQIQQKIADVDRQRRDYLKTEQQKQANGKVGLDDAILKALREQAALKGFEFEVVQEINEGGRSGNTDEVGPQMQDGEQGVTKKDDC